ncbi:glycosyl hydrolase family 95 catalytic domain-containing protein [Paenibacillus sp. 1P07SE]|uniref:glycosyl hydrolase family 95 catalytic domain-containing protein n=1 Tax=Paenibacillus sp. 1P07SE TaxID=3132209 RepID=UPI0039A6E5B5
MKHACSRSYQELLQRHIEDYTSLYKRVELVLDHDPDEEQKPTDERIAAIEQLQDPGLSALYFQYGRYLLISSSRPGGQPANLQGIWNEEKEPLWGSKWTTNINVQMNYWPAESTNLAECHLPLFDLIEDLRESGARAAKAHYNAEGFVVHHNTDLWRAAAPADADAGVWPMGAAWLVQHLWDHYEYAPDRTFLETKVYPAMLDAARFILDYLTEAPADTAEAGKWVTCPSYSPENAYITEDGRSGYLTYAATLDLQLIADLFERCILAAEILNGEASLQARMREALSRMPEMRIGRYGQLQEWIGDWDRPDDANSHVSHLYGLYPGNQISLERTPAWAEAVRTSLQMRGEGRGGWGAAWRIALHAHLRDAAAAHNQLIQLISRSATPNLLNMRPPLPMQIDGNLGGTAGIAEMLLQSRVHYSGQVPEYEIELLPALPSQWPSGSCKGLRARGGFELAAAWRDGRLSKAELSAKRNGICTVRYQDRTMRMEVEANHTYELVELYG